MKVFLVIAIGFSGMILRGYILSVLWAWFLVPLGVMDINIPLAMGISIVVALLTHEYKQQDRDAVELIAAAGQPVALLIIGWLIHLFL